ncbi:MAG: metallophosphoesterase family protein [Planctomycetaceae bacterium]
MRGYVLVIWGCLGLAAGLATSRSVVAHDGPEAHSHKVADAEIHKPTPIPSRIVLTWEGDPATSTAVTWRTSAEIKQGLAQIAVATDGPGFAKTATPVNAVTTPLETEFGPAHWHTVSFTGLTPKTKYAYRVGDGENWSEWFQFQTASNAPEPFSFVYFGDAQNDLRSMWSRVIREASRDAPKAAFMLHAGDLINRAESDADWGEWFQAGGHLHAMIPSVATPGNHEYKVTAKIAGIPTKIELSKYWQPGFAFPKNGPEKLEETCYYIDYQGARIISLNSNDRHLIQAAWLEKVLANNPNKWTIITFHHPLYSTAKGRDNAMIRVAWQAVFDKYKVDIVLQGHDHSYGRTGLLHGENTTTGLAKQSNESGTVYVVSVSGPKQYAAQRSPIFKRVADDTQLYQIIHVDGDQLRYQAHTATGRLYDAFTLQKQPGQPNQLIEQVPDTPENIRLEEAKK